MDKDILKVRVNAEMKKRARIVAIEQDLSLSRVVEKALALYVKRYYDSKQAPNLQAVTNATQKVVREQSQKLGGLK
mgnify:CR=1 FL=1